MYTFVLTSDPLPPLPHSLLPPAPSSPHPVQKTPPSPLLFLMSHVFHYNLFVFAHPHLFFLFCDPLSGLLTCRHRHTHIYMRINSNPGLLYENGAIYNKEIPSVKSLQFAGIKLTKVVVVSHLGLLYPSTPPKFLSCSLLSFWKWDLILICYSSSL